MASINGNPTKKHIYPVTISKSMRIYLADHAPGNLGADPFHGRVATEHGAGEINILFPTLREANKYALWASTWVTAGKRDGKVYQASVL
jgi:hypothetical protein